MNKRTLMVATAVAALTVGSAFAQAPADSHMNPGSRNAPAEKIAPKPNAAAPTAQPNMHRETTGQAPTEQPNAQPSTPKTEKPNNAARPNERNNAARPNDRPNAAQAPSENRNAQAPKDNRNGADENRGTAQNRSNTHAAATLSSEQRTKVHSIIVGARGAPRVARVDFDVKVGVAVPRTVTLAPVPQEIVVIEPTWRGFEYFLVGDEIVVVDPATLEIVAVLPA
jgi:hypothetical protein